MRIAGGCHCGAIRYRVDGAALMSCAVPLHRLPAPCRRADGRLDDVQAAARQGDQGRRPRSTSRPSTAAGISAPIAAPACSTSTKKSCPASSTCRARPTTIPTPSRRGAHPDRRAHRLDEARARIAGVRALSAAALAALLLSSLRTQEPITTAFSFPERCRPDRPNDGPRRMGLQGRRS